MNDNLIVQELAAVLKSDSPYAAIRDAIPHMEAAQAGATTGRPLLTISGEWKHYAAVRLGGLKLEFRSRMGDQAQDHDAHFEKFDALLIAFMGQQAATRAETEANRAAAFAAMKTALEAREKLTLEFYGMGEGGIVADSDGEDYVSAVTLNMAWRFLPAA